MKLMDDTQTEGPPALPAKVALYLWLPEAQNQSTAEPILELVKTMSSPVLPTALPAPGALSGSSRVSHPWGQPWRCCPIATHPGQSLAGQHLEGLYHVVVILGTDFKVGDVLLFTPALGYLLGHLNEGKTRSLSLCHHRHQPHRHHIARYHVVTIPPHSHF